MAGIGKYKKGAKFTLKSGNKPTFKMIGSSSPMNLKNFGIGKGTSPYKDSEEDARSEKENTVNNANNTENTNTEKNNKEERSKLPSQMTLSCCFQKIIS